MSPFSSSLLLRVLPGQPILPLWFPVSSDALLNKDSNLSALYSPNARNAGIVGDSAPRLCPHPVCRAWLPGALCPYHPLSCLPCVASGCSLPLSCLPLVASWCSLPLSRLPRVVFWCSLPLSYLPGRAGGQAGGRAGGRAGTTASTASRPYFRSISSCRFGGPYRDQALCHRRYRDSGRATEKEILPTL